MATSPVYSSTPEIGVATISTANTNRDGTGTIGVVQVAKNNGNRIETINIIATGTTTAGMVRLYVSRGFPGATVSSITYSSTTATVTTSVAHGLTTGDLVTVQGVSPREYNVTNVAATVVNATTFTYTLASTPTSNATTVGQYQYTSSSPTISLLKEIPVTAITPSGTVTSFVNSQTSETASDIMPLYLPAGWSLRASTNNAESFVVEAIGGSF